MISNLAVGAGFMAFVALLVPPYITEAAGDAAAAGVVMAIISLAAILGPVLGNLADRYRAHRQVMSLGVLGMAIAFAAFALAAEDVYFAAIDAILMGVSIAAVGAIGPVFIVGAGLSQGLQAKRLTTYNLVAPVGQVLGGAMMAGAAAAGWSFSQRFWLAAAVMAVAAAITWFSSSRPASHIELGVMATNSDSGKENDVVKATARQVIISTFGLYILILVLISITSNGVNNQISNILPNLYGIDAKTTAGLISLAGLLNLGCFVAAGAWMARSGAMTVFTAGTVARLAGSLSMALIALVADAPLLLVAAAMMLLYQGTPFVRMSQPVLAVRFAPLPAGEANGWVLGASAIGSFIGSALGGWLADKAGFNAINWMAAITAGMAFALIIFFLWPANRRMRGRDADKEPVSALTQ